jgi:hypothetical protein
LALRIQEQWILAWALGKDTLGETRDEHELKRAPSRLLGLADEDTAVT